MKELSSWLDAKSGIEGTLGYVVIIICAILGHAWVNGSGRNDVEVEEEAVEEEEPPRNFTAMQLKHFDGTKDEKTGEDKPVYLAVKGIVFDVSSGRDFYGPGGAYEMFSGHECGVALAKMSFDEKYIDDFSWESLNFGEKTELDGWIEKFQYYRSYPVKGRLVPEKSIPPSDKTVSTEELAKNDGSMEIPEGYAAAPIYVAAGGKVFDVSFGGVTFYGKDGAYSSFAGVDASRALAKMSFDPSDIENPTINDLTEKEKKCLDDWIKTFGERKQYPVVGILKSS
uniref:Cytochrome b5 heme-binding domain-containing protein n=2 Tax=Odontella aurita TaxID=265563 RepID=A0A7S4NEZ3_9STRA|mmetsp:Transcript_6037/g.17636  ORF Transcript_6037/g.17636 Transcript_6037/m.17636 type:complete len:283 (+) Transcript_6037:156-1004(+)|eukprot:CAMPEP_0113549594 /NCGR_PEP_ID=MMETSP0015_2-20120614/13518_1 /TAXON_ID=2838 /ORGANISM="Odontella" /LENGTH=282 /DNA_ID=CAMNT_0000450317 /DNA_START=120 /DNA_END=968 /DNA_ORIENTATION=- /assembly_acc=CAM_ASM_000160